MTHEEYQNSIMAIADRYGYNAQSRQLIEEMAELTVAINKMWRREQSEKVNHIHTRSCSERAIFEEIADVEICIEQLKYLMSCHDEVEKEKARKIERQVVRMRNEPKSKA